MKLNEAQQRIVSENMGLVGKVIKDKVHGVNQLGVYTYDDILPNRLHRLVQGRPPLTGAAVSQPTPTG